MAESLNLRAGIGMTSARTRGRMVERLREQGIKDEIVLAAMGTVPRHLFVDQALESRAYEDTALPIGFGQTISNPYIVARMAELARHGEASQGRELGRVLEIGLGCGYQAAVLGKLAREVVSLERIAALVGKPASACANCGSTTSSPSTATAWRGRRILRRSTPS